MEQLAQFGDLGLVEERWVVRLGHLGHWGLVEMFLVNTALENLFEYGRC